MLVEHATRLWTEALEEAEGPAEREDGAPARRVRLRRERLAPEVRAAREARELEGVLEARATRRQRRVVARVRARAVRERNLERRFLPYARRRPAPLRDLKRDGVRRAVLRRADAHAAVLLARERASRVRARLREAFGEERDPPPTRAGATARAGTRSTR